ncbi:MAG: SH3 domain-containing C40 family peptidase [Oscillospiraceae bacterium]|nr:SH3 domain-containing C40 family peptidase [Oscillospiraceae bacterium]
MSLAVVKPAIAALKKFPDASSQRTDEVLHGMQVEILETVSSRWCKVRTWYRYEGYLPLQALQLGNVACLWNKLPKKVVCRPYCDLLIHPDLKSRRLLSLTRGALVYPSGRQCMDGWRKISLCDGREGYIKDSCLQPPAAFCQEEEESFRQDVVRTALGYLGVQYRWGGKTPLGIDCSGLCSMSYLLNGFVIYRDAKLVPGFPLHQIPPRQAKPGDLIFFPGHMAMYLGGGRMVHSTAKEGSDGVVISSLLPGHPDYRADLAEQVVCFASIF